MRTEIFGTRQSHHNPFQPSTTQGKSAIGGRPTVAPGGSPGFGRSPIKSKPARPTTFNELIDKHPGGRHNTRYVQSTNGRSPPPESRHRTIIGFIARFGHRSFARRAAGSFVFGGCQPHAALRASLHSALRLHGATDRRPPSAGSCRAQKYPGLNNPTTIHSNHRQHRESPPQADDRR